MVKGQNLLTIGEVKAALQELRTKRGKEALIRGNLKSALWDIASALKRPLIFAYGEEGNIDGILDEFREVELKENDEIIELSEKYSEKIQQHLNEETGTRAGEVDAARVKALVDEYELHLKNNEDDPKRAKEEFLRKYERSPEVREVLQQLEAIKADCKSKLATSELKGDDLDRAAQTLAEEVIVQEEKAKEVGIDPQRVTETLVTKAVEVLKKEVTETETIDKITQSIGDEINDEVKGAITEADNLLEQQDFVLSLAEAGELAAQRLLLEHQVELAKEGLIRDIENANDTPNTNGTLKIAPEVLNQKDNLGRALSSITAKNLGQLDHNEVIEELRLKGFDVGAMGEEIKEYIKGVNKLLENNPRTATYVAQLESQRAMAAEIIQVNPQASTQSAYEYAGLATRFDGEFIGTNRAKIISDAQRELDEQGARGKDRPSYNGLSSKLTELQMMAGLATMSPDEYNKFNEEYKNLRGKFFNIPEGAGSLKLRSLDNVLSLFNKDERLQGVLKLLQKNGGIRKLAEGWATASQNGLLGKALAGLAKSGLGEGAQSFFTWAASGTVFRKGLETGLAAVGKRLAGTAAGKVVVSIGAKLGISAIGGAVTGGIGWLVSAGMFALDIGKNLISGISKSLGAVGLDLLKDGKKLLQDLGMDNPVGKALGLLGLIGAGIVGLIGSALAAAAIPVALISSVMGLLMLNTQANLGNYATFRPDAVAIKSAQGGLQGGALGGLGQAIACDSNGTPLTPVPDGCPQGWPVTVPGRIIQGPHGTFSHSVIEAIDIVGLNGDFGGTPILSTQTGTVTYGGDDNGSYGYFADVTAVCNGTTMTTRYGHMAYIPSVPKSGSSITKGTIIGIIDNSGSYRQKNIINGVVSNHLHYEILYNNTPINNYLCKQVPDGCYDFPPSTLHCNVSFP